MSEGPSQLPGPDLSRGVALNSLVDGEMLLGHVGGEPAVLVRRDADLLPSVRHAPTTATRFPRGSSSVIQFVARGTTPASVYTPVRRCVHRR